MKIKITNQELFDSMEVDVDVQDNGRTQNIIISWCQDGNFMSIESDGEIGRYDYVEMFGFEIQP